MPKVHKRPCCVAPHIDDFLRAHGGAECVKHREAAEIMGVSLMTISRMLDDGRLSRSPHGRVLMRSIHAWLWPATDGKALRVVR